VVDAEDCGCLPSRMDDPLWRAQVDSADLVLVSRSEIVDPTSVLMRLGAVSRAPLLLPDGAALPVELLLGFGGSEVSQVPRALVTADRFASLEIVNSAPVGLEAFQSAMEALAPSLLRAKGILSFKEMPTRAFLFQMVGRRATIAPYDSDSFGCKLVLIGDRSSFDLAKARSKMTELWVV
jgi:G3E family GTPase